MNGIKKVALFLSGLEWNTADMLLGRLTPDEARAVRLEMRMMDNIPVQESERVTVEFLKQSGFRETASRKESDWQKETYKLPLTGRRNISEPQSLLPNSPQNSSHDSKRQPFRFLRSLPAKTIADELTQEMPQTVAVVLAHLPASKAGEVLAVLPNPLQLDVAERLTNYTPMDEQLLQDIESALKERFLRRLETETRKFKEAAFKQSILSSMKNKTYSVTKS